MSRFAIDVSGLPFPSLIEPLDYETILSDMKGELLVRWPAVDLESEPLIALLEANAYYRLLDRARVNDAAKAVFVAYASGTDLDNIGAFFGVQRRVIISADTEANPPVLEEREADEEFRRRILLALEAQSTAGPRGAYLYFALSADPEIYDASVVGPDDVSPVAPGPGIVNVYLLSRAERLSSGAVAAVQAALNAEDVRPLCDTVVVQAAATVPYDVTAMIKFYNGPDQSVVLAAARSALDRYTSRHYRLGHDIKRSGLIAALHREGVYGVDLISPVDDIILHEGQAGRVGTVTLTNGGVDV